ncbi:hypothetical protein SAMN05216199_2520 [Pedococcus cremeus]|uniref:Uncharacterized protein n=1 Tax=Pedococcus cremeus TaxID=587636 RepID=A0A1H9VR42_9MICO|nr:hypothetical protein SAMN05216199_2520 [Pedococcus cremeus]
MGTPHQGAAGAGAGRFPLVNAPRRTPNFTRFIATGAILGFVVGAVATLFTERAPGLSETSAMFYIGVFGAAIGAVLGALVAVAFERRG